MVHCDDAICNGGCARSWAYVEHLPGLPGLYSFEVKLLEAVDLLDVV